MAITIALLLQALFALPLAMRMAADATQWPSFGNSICEAAADEGSAAHQHGPAQLPVDHHGQCPLCQGHALPLVTLAVVLVALLVGSAVHTIRRARPHERPWRRDRYQYYHSRAPPLAV